MIKRFITLCLIFFGVTFTMLFAFNVAVATPGRLYDIDAVIVLGAGLDGVEVGHILRNRLDQAVMRFNADPSLVIVVSGGQGADQLVPEAYAMKNYLLRRGVPASSIIMEPLSTNTRENLLFSRHKLDSHLGHTPKVAIATNNFHMFRSLNYARRAGLSATGLSAPTARRQLPRLYLREYLAVMWYYAAWAWR